MQKDLTKSNYSCLQNLLSRYKNIIKGIKNPPTYVEGLFFVI